jgi:signal peptidase I
MVSPGKALLFLVTAAVFAAWAFTLRPTFLGGPAGYVMVSGKSMEPTLRTGDLVVTRRQADYGRGDIVAFRVEGGTVIHRIVGGDGVGGFEVQGDNKDAPDQWHPTNRDIAGKLWLYLPGKGRWLAWTRAPQNLSAIAGGLAAMTLVGGSQARKGRFRTLGRRNKRMSGNGDGGGRWALDQMPGPLWAWTGMAVAGLLAVAFGALAVKSFSTAPSRTQTVERARYVQSGALNYTINMQPSTLYPDGKVVAVLPPLNVDPRMEQPVVGRVEVPPVYTRLAKSIDVSFRYAVAGLDAAGVSGEIGADLQIRAGAEGGWTKTQALVPPVAFQGNEATVRASIDLAPLQTLIETVEKETGFTPGAYELVIVPRVKAVGAIGGEPLELAYAPAFTFKYTKTTITPDAALQRTEPKSIGGPETSPRRLSLGPVGLPIAAARPLTAALAIAALGVAGLFAAVAFLGVGQDEAVKAQVRYRVKMVRVEEADHGGSRCVRVGALSDLARLAQASGGVVFSQDLPTGPLYFVPDGSVTYEYSAAGALRAAINGHTPPPTNGARPAPPARARARNGREAGDA